MEDLSALVNAALEHHRAGRLEEAKAIYLRVLAANPNHDVALSMLGTLLHAQGQLAPAADLIRRSLQINPNNANTRNNLGVVLRDMRRPEEAAAFHKWAIELRGDVPSFYNNLGNALRDLGKFEEAEVMYRQAVAMDPTYVDALSNLAGVLAPGGRIKEAIEAFRAAAAIEPAKANVHSNLIYAMQFDPDADERAIAEEHARWNRRFAQPLRGEISEFQLDRSPDRRLRIGYVSSDFYLQAESYFALPLLANHNHAEFEIFCYSGVLSPDDVTAKIRSHADVWRETGGSSDAAIAQMIRADKIDILVDLTMHMARNRALVFVRKPAPIQVCWLAYPGSGGLPTVDYRFSDAAMDSDAAAMNCYSEKTIFLPDCWVAYDPLADLLPVSPREGALTFGSLNNPGKINDGVVDLWASALAASPGARILLLIHSADHRQRIVQRMAAAGVSADRIEFVSRMSRQDYLRAYERIDVALDPLPYNGITTTCDALCMGVPVLTLVGKRAAGRAGASMLGLLGLNEWITRTPAEFVARCAALAANPSSARELRSTLRERIEKSPLMDGRKFARSVETAYRQMWQCWCAV